MALTFFSTQAPDCNLVPYALQELDKVLLLFEDARHKVPFAAKALVSFHISSLLTLSDHVLIPMEYRQPALEVMIARARSFYMQHRTGVAIPRDYSDEVCRLGQRVGLVQHQGVAGMSLKSSEPNPFKHAHSSLVRCLEQASMESPCGPGVLARMRGSVGQMHKEGDPESAWPRRHPSAQFGSDIHDAAWMSWL